MWMFSLEMLALLKQDCWFELPKITLHGFFEEESTAFKVLYMCAWDLGLLYFYIFNLFFPLGVHLYLAGWRLISSYYLVLPLFKSKASVYVILTPSLIISSFFFFFFGFFFPFSNSRAWILSVVFFLFSWFEVLTCCILLVYQWCFSADFFSQLTCVTIILLFNEGEFSDRFIIFLLKFLNTMKYKRCSISI